MTCRLQWTHSPQIDKHFKISKYIIIEVTMLVQGILAITEQ